VTPDDAPPGDRASDDDAGSNADDARGDALRDEAAATTTRDDRAAGPRGSATFVERVGLAIVQPRWALAVAADRRFAGRSGSDLIRVICIVLLATQMRGLFASGWLAYAVDLSFGFRGLAQVLTQALTVDLAFLVVGALVLWAIAGPRRNLGRAFDLACVAVLPLLYVDLAVTVVVRGFDLHVPGVVGIVLAAASYAWTGGLLGLAARPARSHAAARSGAEGSSVGAGARSRVVEVPDVVRVPARRAGWAVIAVAVAGVVVQVVWLAQHPEEVRPMHAGDRAPELTLPAIEPDGTFGPKLALSSVAGKIVIVDFWAPWCKPCLASMPRLDALAKQHDDLVVIAVAIEDFKESREIFDAGHYHMRLVAGDPETKLRYGVTGIPHSVLIDRGQMVRTVVRGNEAALEAAVDALYR